MKYLFLLLCVSCVPVKLSTEHKIEPVKVVWDQQSYTCYIYDGWFWRTRLSKGQCLEMIKKYY